MDQDLKKKRIILGLDVSTRCIGSTVASLDDDGAIKILEISHLRLKTPSKIKGTKSLFLKSDLFKQKLKDKYMKYYITDVIIEEPLISSNNSETAATLMRFNGMISQSVKDILGVSLQMTLEAPTDNIQVVTLGNTSQAWVELYSAEVEK